MSLEDAFLDFHSKPIKVGDIVIYTSTNRHPYFSYGEVISLTPKFFNNSVEVKPFSGVVNITRWSHNLIIDNKEHT